MQIAIASDHAGFNLKATVKRYIKEMGHECHDVGPNDTEAVDYPDFAFKVADAVAQGKYDQGILICGTGIGMSIVANKVNGIRAALCHDVFSAKSARAHNDANILCMGERVIGIGLAQEIVNAYLSTGFEGGRHSRRLEKMHSHEK